MSGRRVENDWCNKIEKEWYFVTIGGYFSRSKNLFLVIIEHFLKLMLKRVETEHVESLDKLRKQPPHCGIFEADSFQINVLYNFDWNW